MKISPILTTKERENAGAMASNRFAYQINWGVCKLIELHKISKPYFLLMEKHDDALICDDVKVPSFIEFYQVKTKKGRNWKIQSLTTSTKSGSIVSKMYSSREKFGNLASKLSFRTNTFFEIKKYDDTGFRPPLESFRIVDL